MIKKIYAALAFSFISMTALGASVAELNKQLAHLQAQIKKVTVSWQKAELTLQETQKLNLVLYHETQSDIKDILAREKVITAMDDAVDQQADAILNSQKPYEAINFLAVYFPTLLPKIESTDSENQKTAKKYLSTIMTTMANRQFRLLLGRNLVNKERRIVMAIKRAQKREEAQ